MRSPECRPAEGTSHPPTLVHPAALVLVPAELQITCAAAVISPHVLVVGHPYVDIWQAFKPAALGITAWPVVPRGTPW